MDGGWDQHHSLALRASAARCLLEVLSELDSAEQRRFLRFVTGCPRLPPGGIAALQPRLTVVRKPPSSNVDSGATPGGTPVGSFKVNTHVLNSCSQSSHTQGPI